MSGNSASVFVSITQGAASSGGGAASAALGAVALAVGGVGALALFGAIMAALFAMGVLVIVGVTAFGLAAGARWVWAEVDRAQEAAPLEVRVHRTVDAAGREGWVPLAPGQTAPPLALDAGVTRLGLPAGEPVVRQVERAEEWSRP